MEIPQSTTMVRNLESFLMEHSCKQGGYTHTRMSGGKYYIPENEFPQFYKLYINAYLKKKHSKIDSITEKQLTTNCPILIDLDFRYNTDVTKRQHTKKDIEEIIYCYLDIIKEIYKFNNLSKVPVYVFQKPNINNDSDVVKDGIHIIIGIQMEREIQILLRSKVINVINQYISLPIKNTWEDVFDKKITDGSVGWMMYGSKKPVNREKYELTGIYEYTFDTTDSEFIETEISIDNIDICKLFPKLSAQYNDHPSFPLLKSFEADLDLYRKQNTSKQTSLQKKRNTHNLKKVSIENLKPYEIRNEQELDDRIDELFKNLHYSDYKLKEIHEYTMILDEKYYDPHGEWISVGWALKNTDNNLFFTWIKFSSKSSKFSYSDIPTYWDKWIDEFKNGDKQLTFRSICGWAIKCDSDKFHSINKQSIDYYIDQCVKELNDSNIAKVLFKLYSNRFMCVELGANHASWVEYENHRWVLMPDAFELKLLMQNDVTKEFNKKLIQTIVDMKPHEKKSPEYEELEKRFLIIRRAIDRLKENNKINSIVRVSQTMFYKDAGGKYYEDKADSNPYLMHFENGVIDFKEKKFRDGVSTDYLTKTTNAIYIPPDNWDNKIVREINQFMKTILPDDELREYIWQTLASILIGINRHQTLNIFEGKGSNGKSMLIKLMELCLGEYQDILPPQYITRPRGTAGGTSSELAQLKGLRLAQINEISQTDKIYEGSMKELTGSDRISCRALYKSRITYTPQFKIIILTNVLPEIQARDDGTWRRVKVVPFVAQFKETLTAEEKKNPNYHLKDYTLEEKLVAWKDTFVSMLIHKAFETDGLVKDCEIVLRASKEYKMNQDHAMKFIEEKIISAPGSYLKQSELKLEYEEWFKLNNGDYKPKIKDLYKSMSDNFGEKIKSKGWADVAIQYDDDTDF